MCRYVKILSTWHSNEWDDTLLDDGTSTVDDIKLKISTIRTVMITLFILFWVCKWRFNLYYYNAIDWIKKN